MEFAADVPCLSISFWNEERLPNLIFSSFVYLFFAHEVRWAAFRTPSKPWRRQSSLNEACHPVVDDQWAYLSILSNSGEMARTSGGDVWKVKDRRTSRCCIWHTAASRQHRKFRTEDLGDLGNLCWRDRLPAKLDPFWNRFHSDYSRVNFCTLSFSSSSLLVYYPCFRKSEFKKKIGTVLSLPAHLGLQSLRSLRTITSSFQH